MAPPLPAGARMGVGCVLILGDDVLDTDSNVRRVFGSTAAALRTTAPPAKVDIVGRQLDQLELGTRVDRDRRGVLAELLGTGT